MEPEGLWQRPCRCPLRGNGDIFVEKSARRGPACAAIVGLPPSSPKTETAQEKRQRKRKKTPSPLSARGLLLHGPLGLDLRQRLDLPLALLRHLTLGGLLQGWSPLPALLGVASTPYGPVGPPSSLGRRLLGRGEGPRSSCTWVVEVGECR